MEPASDAGRQRLVFDAPSRGLIGFRAAFAAITRGSGTLNRAFSRRELGIFGALESWAPTHLLDRASLSRPASCPAFLA
jgi:hypothetical protein